MSAIEIRKLTPEDGAIAARIFFDAVHIGTADVYTRKERDAWAGTRPDPSRWAERIGGLEGYVAEDDGVPVGFMTIDASGFIDLAFVAPGAAGQGVGWHLYRRVEERARELGATRMTTEASKKARPFFERQGWSVDREQTVERNGVMLTNYRMSKRLGEA